MKVYQSTQSLGDSLGPDKSGTDLFRTVPDIIVNVLGVQSSYRIQWEE